MSGKASVAGLVQDKEALVEYLYVEHEYRKTDDKRLVAKLNALGLAVQAANSFFARKDDGVGTSEFVIHIARDFEAYLLEGPDPESAPPISEETSQS